MAESYSTPEAPAQQKKDNTKLIIIIIVVVIALLLCCCAVVIVGPIFGLNLLGPTIGSTFSNIIEQLGTPAP